MRYLVREKIFTLANRFTIEDDKGYAHYNIVGKIFTFGKKLNIYDMNGKPLIYIEQRLLRFLPEYTIYKDNVIVGKIKKEFTFMRPRFKIESTYGKLKIDGDIFQHNFNILRDGKVVACINKRWVSFSDTYSVEIAEGENHPFILAVVIILDQILYDGGNSNNN